MAEQSLPLNALQEIERARSLVDRLRAELHGKRDQLRVRDDAILPMAQKRDRLRAECFDLEEQILDAQIRIVARYVANGLRLPTFIHLEPDPPEKAKGATAP